MFNVYRKMNVSILVKDGKRCDNVHGTGVPDSNPEHLLNLSALPDGIPDLKNQFYQQVCFFFFLQVNKKYANNAKYHP